jgi:hypothetical protein
MKIQLETKTHETDLKELRAERHSEDCRLNTLKARLQDTLSEQQPTLFAMHTNGRVNAA